MGGVRLYPLVAIVLVLETVCSAQTASTITNPTLEFKDNKIHIVYDILNSDTTQLYNVRLEITDSAGNVIDAHTFSGDIGTQIQGGEDKCIIWSFQADNVNIDGDLYIQIYAAADRKEFSRASLILQSMAFPGLGLTRLNGGPHWLKGVAGYGCIAGSVILNRMAISTYDDYRNPGSAEQAGTLLAQAGRQDNISEVLAFVAAGIWVTDLVWTIIGTSDKRKEGSLNGRRGITVVTGFDPAHQVPLLSFRYRF
jgi:hypothetical protein